MIWPEKARYAFMITIDIDGDLPLLAEHPDNVYRLKSRSAGNYGPKVGAWRLHSLLHGLGLTAHWFIPGEIAARYPELVLELHEGGHGIGVHGHRHLDFDRIALDEQLAEMEAGRSAVQRITGEAPSGFRIPGGEWAAGFPEAMERLGFDWSSSLPSDELPFHLVGTGLTEIPFRYELEDQQYLGYNLDPPFPPGQSRITPLESVEANWAQEIRGAEHYGTLVHLRLNAEVMGIPGRARMLARFLGTILQRGNAWFASPDSLHELFSAQQGDPAHPYAMFVRLSEQQR